MSITSVSENPTDVKTQPIDIAGRQYTITRLTERCWLLTDDVTLVTRQFSTSEALWSEVKRMSEPVRIPDLSLPQLPARALAYSFDVRVDKNLRRNRITFRQNHPMRYPTRGVICLPAPAAPQQAPQPTKAQQHVADEFLKNAEEFFKAWNDLNNRKLTPRNARGRKWDMDCAFQNMSHKAYTYAQMVGTGI
jgi:hypothetical protein